MNGPTKLNGNGRETVDLSSQFAFAKTDSSDETILVSHKAVQQGSLLYIELVLRNFKEKKWATYEAEIPSGMDLNNIVTAFPQTASSVDIGKIASAVFRNNAGRLRLSVYATAAFQSGTVYTATFRAFAMIE